MLEICGMSRRHLAVGGAAAVALAGCAATGTTTTSTSEAMTLQTGVQAIAQGLSGVLTELQSIVPNLPATTTAQIITALSALQADAAQIGAVATASSGGALAGIGAAVTALEALVTPFFPQAAFIGAMIQTALTLLPTLEAMVGAAPASLVAPSTHKLPAMTNNLAVQFLMLNAKRFGKLPG